MTIGIDLDGVTADSLPKWLSMYNHDYGDNLTPDDIHGWDLVPYVKPECGKKIYDYLRRPDFYKGTKPVDGAQEGVAKVREMGHRVVFVTAGYMQTGKFEWLRHHKFLEHERDFVIAFDKSLFCLDAMVDDKPENLFSFPVRILFDQPHNRAYNGEVSVNRARGWKGVIECLTSLSKTPANA